MRTLVLNAGFEPLAVVSYRRALILVLNQKASIIASDSSFEIRSQSGTGWFRPSVIVLSRYVSMHHQKMIPVSRRGVLRRDNHKCGYCGAGATTIDHILPRSRGGEDSWQNLVACCLSCNNIKGNRTPKEMGWHLLFRPRMPTGVEWFVSGIDTAQPQWQEYLQLAA